MFLVCDWYQCWFHDVSNGHVLSYPILKVFVNTYADWTGSFCDGIEGRWHILDYSPDQVRTECLKEQLLHIFNPWDRMIKKDKKRLHRTIIQRKRNVRLRFSMTVWCLLYTAYFGKRIGSYGYSMHTDIAHNSLEYNQWAIMVRFYYYSYYTDEVKA